jgi:type II secretion system protein D
VPSLVSEHRPEEPRNDDVTLKRPMLLKHSALMLVAAGLCIAPPGAAMARQDDRPQPADPAIAAGDEANQTPERAAALEAETQSEPQTQPTLNGNRNGRTTGFERPVQTGPRVKLGFDNVSVEQVIPFIMEATGKVVMPIGMPVLKTKTITLMNDQFVERAAALDLLITALRLNGVGVIEKEDVVILDDVANISRTGVMPVLTASEDIMTRTDKGLMVVKIFKMKDAPVQSAFDLLDQNRPDNAVLTVDANSNQIVLYGDIGFAQYVQQMIDELDQNYIQVDTRVFDLKYADANEVAEQIYELFEDTDATAQTGVPRQPRQARPSRTANPNAPVATAAGTSIGPTVPLRVSVNTQQNNVTVAAEPKKIAAIAELILNAWDLPRPDGTKKIYLLKYTDPVKVQTLLGDLLGTGGGTTRAGGARAGGAAGGVRQAPAQGTDMSQQLSAIYRFQAFPDSQCLVVLSKTEDALGFLDSIIESIDQPSTIGLPTIVALKHANAVSLAQELNLLLAEPGGGAGIGLDAPQSGLTGPTIGSLSDAGTSGSTGGSRTGGGTDGAAAGGGGRLTFPWQSGQRRDDVSPETSLIGRVRIMPIIRQNALAVLTPPEKREAVIQLIEEFDRPGRQVMISAVLASVQLTDELALGLRFSSFPISPTNPDNALGGTAAFEGTNNSFLDNLFDTTVLDVNVDVNVLLQALAQKTNVRILQEPRVFTADNEEAVFFDGQNIPVLESTNTSDVGGFQQNVNYRDVGVVLNARPRITSQRDVDMEIYLELSNVVPGQTLAGSPVFDQRYTSTRVIVKNNQTIVLAGILKDQESQITRGIPLLMDIPWIGELFKSRENNLDRRELVAFITPVVVDNPEENDTNFNATERDNLRDIARPLKEQMKEKTRMRDKIVNPKGASYEGEPTRPAPEHVEEPPPDSKPAPLDEGVRTEEDIMHDIDELATEPEDR